MKFVVVLGSDGFDCLLGGQICFFLFNYLSSDAKFFNLDAIQFRQVKNLIVMNGDMVEFVSSSSEALCKYFVLANFGVFVIAFK